jgi:formylglycine-generating enzyme required for sulfatase activity
MRKSLIALISLFCFALSTLRGDWVELTLEVTDDISSTWTEMPITSGMINAEGKLQFGAVVGNQFYRLNVQKMSGPVAPVGFAVIPGGSFQMGDALDGASDAPVVTVNISEFYMGKYEVTKSEWDAVRTWGLSNGYTDLSAGSGKGANHPVHSIDWYAMVKWCNARSEQEGRTPCYTVSGLIYRTGNNDDVVCDWTANGYRLPTEAEWEKAARGGMTGKRFPWGDTISHANANYKESTSYSYDTGDGSGYHPDYFFGSTPYTSPVGSFAANDYGLYDMAGNVSEWCWDWYSDSSYIDGRADPRGASSGDRRVHRGGAWGNVAPNCRVGPRSLGIQWSSNYYYGLRVALSSVPQ